MSGDSIKKVYGYCRVSTLGQQNEGESLDVQELKIKDYCKMKGLEIITIHKEAVSGSEPPHKRTQLNCILANLKAGVGNGLVVCKIDRLSRSTKDFLLLMSDFKDKYDFYCVNPDMDSSTTIGKFTMNLLSIVSELEVNMIRDRTKEVLAEKKKRGEVVGMVPFGKRIIPNTNLLEDEPEEQETMKMVRELRATMKEVTRNNKQIIRCMTLDEICDELISRGRKNKQGNSNFFPAQIRRILNEGGKFNSGRKTK